MNCKGILAENTSDTNHQTETDQTSHVCQVCQKSFTDRGGLLKHIRIHTGEKPYICMTCHKAFAVKVHMINHVRIHTGEKPYICEICQRGFAVQFHLDQHMRIHTGEKPYVCEVCHKAFAVKSSVINHQRSHTGEKPHVCEICSKAFASKSELNQHVRTHTGEKPYICEVCKKSFAQNGHLNRHLRIHFGNNINFTKYSKKPNLKSVTKPDYTEAVIYSQSLENNKQYDGSNETELSKNGSVVNLYELSESKTDSQSVFYSDIEDCINPKKATDINYYGDYLQNESLSLDIIHNVEESQFANDTQHLNNLDNSFMPLECILNTKDPTGNKKTINSKSLQIEGTQSTLCSCIIKLNTLETKNCVNLTNQESASISFERSLNVQGSVCSENSHCAKTIVSAVSCSQSKPKFRNQVYAENMSAATEYISDTTNYHVT